MTKLKRSIIALCAVVAAGCASFGMIQSNYSQYSEIPITANAETVNYADFFNINANGILTGVKEDHKLDSTFIVPKEVKQIRATAFNGCTNFKYLSVEEGSLLDFIADGALNSVVIENVPADEDGIKYLGNVAVGYGDSATPSTVKDGTKSIYGGAFAGCGMKEFTVPDNVTIGLGSDAYNGKGTFAGCENLQSLTIPYAVLPDATATHFNLKELFRDAEDNKVLPAVLKKICVTGGKGISPNAFEDCAGIEEFEFKSAELTDIGNYAFNGCRALRSIKLPDGIISVGTHAFQNCTALVSIKLPSTVTRIDDYAFNGCVVLANVNIPEGVTYIGTYAFADCAIRSISIPSKIESVDLSRNSNLTVYLPEKFGSSDAEGDPDVELGEGSQPKSLLEILFATESVHKSSIIIVPDIQAYEMYYGEAYSNYTAYRNRLFYKTGLTFEVEHEGKVLSSEVITKLANKEEASLRYVCKTDAYGNEYWEYDVNYVFPSVIGSYGVDNTKWSNNGRLINVSEFILANEGIVFTNTVTAFPIALSETVFEKQYDNVSWTLPENYAEIMFISAINGEEGSEVVDAGDYTITVVPADGYLWEDGTTTGRTLSLKIIPLTLDLSKNENINWELDGYSNGMLGGRVYVYSENGRSIPYISAQAGMTLVTDRTVEESIVWYRNVRTVDIVIENIPQTLDGKDGYSVNYSLNNIPTNVGAGAGVYTTTVTLSPDKNYKFTLSNHMGLVNRGMDVTVNGDGTATVIKTWYIVRNVNNIQVGETDLSDYSINDRTFGSDESAIEQPFVRYGNGEAEVTFSLTLRLAGVSKEICSDENISSFGNYINSSMPAGEYILTFKVGSYTGMGSDKDVFYDAVERNYTFKVNPADIKLGNIDNENLRYEYKYDADTVGNLFDSFISAVGEKLTLCEVEPEGWWAEHSEDYYSSDYEITFNLARMFTNDYYANTDARLINILVPGENSTFTFYYQITSKNHNNLAGTSNKYDYSFVVVLYEELSLPEIVTSPVYTGVKVNLDLDTDKRYSVVWLDSDSYITAGEHTLNLVLNDYEHYRWADGINVSGKNKEVAELVFNVEKATNFWRSYPNISSWNYGSVNSKPSAQPYYLDSDEQVEFKYIACNSDKEEIGEPVSTVPTQAGRYKLVATVKETGNYYELTDTVEFEIIRMQNHWEMTPNILSWQWKSYDPTVNVISAVPAHGEEVQFRIYYKDANNNPILLRYDYAGYGQYRDKTVFLLEADGSVPQYVSEVLKNLSAGEYYLLATVAGSDNYTGLNSSFLEDATAPLDAGIRFEVHSINNYWTKMPNVVSWQWNDYDEELNIISAVPAYGVENLQFRIFRSTVEEGKNIYNPLTYNYAGYGESGDKTVFALNADGTVPEYVKAVLKGLTAGEYYLLASVAGTQNYTGLNTGTSYEDGIKFEVYAMNNYWKQTPNIISWKWDDYDPSVNLITAESAYGNDSLAFSIYTYENLEYIPVTFDVNGTEVSSFKLNINGNVPTYVSEVLSGLKVGMYYLLAKVDGGVNYTGLNDGLIGESVISFDVSKIDNSWEEVPCLIGWSEGNFKLSDNSLTAAAKHGNENRVITIIDETTGKTVITIDMSKGDKIDYAKISDLSVGAYLLKVRVEGTENYNTIEATTGFAVFEDSVGVSGLIAATMTFGGVVLVLAVAALVLLIRRGKKIESEFRSMVNKELHGKK